MYQYKIKSIEHIVDGDTFDCIVDLGFSILHKIRVRMYGINTPESRTRDLEEKARGLASKKRLTELLDDLELVLKTAKKGKYGRYLGIVYSSEHNVNSQMVEEGFAVEYFGGKR